MKITMADKRRLGQVVSITQAPREKTGGRKRRNTPPIEETSRHMVEAEQALFSALCSVKPPQAATQPPPRTSSSRKKTAA